MKHAGAQALDRLAPLLGRLRKRESLREKTPGVFYWKSRAFLHFHEDPEGLFADLRTTGDFERFRVSSRAEQGGLVRRVDAHLAGAAGARPKRRSA